MSKIIEKVDVIAEFKADGTIIPMRFRIMTEDGEYEAFTIKAYKQNENQGAYATKDGIFVSNADIVFQCKTIAYNTEKYVRLYFHKASLSWKLAY